MEDNSISSLSTDIATQMLAAITDVESNSEKQVVNSVSLEEQKKYLKKHIDTVTIADRKAIGNSLVIDKLNHLLHACNEGTVINLEVVPPESIEKMFLLLKYKVDSRK